jgi:GAF domain-containing protein
MKRRSKVSGERINKRRRKTPEPKRRHAPKALAASSDTEETEIARLTRELSDERRRRTSTSEVLRLLSGSHGDLNHLFETILANATNLCQANFGTLSLCEGEAFRIVAMNNVPPGLAELRRREPLVRAGPLLRMAETKRLLHIADYTEYVASHPADSDAAAFAKLTGVRTILEVPMLKDDAVVGAVVVYRTEVRRFDDREIALVKDFAAQAVIAIENARLLKELRQRTNDLTEALEQQTATSDVLQVISSSTGDLEPVFVTMLEKAVRYCDANFGTLFLCEADNLSLVAAHNMPSAFSEAHRSRPGIVPGGPVETAIRTRRTIHVRDLAAVESYLERHPRAVDAVELGGVRTTVAVPMLKDDEPIGVIAIHRPEVRPFTDNQIKLVEDFASQAVIAIENGRLLNELRQSLEQQTATSEVLQVISSAPGELELVFATMLENAARICDAKFAALYRLEGDGLRLTATHNVPQAFAEAQGTLFRPAPGGALDGVLKTGRTAHLSDLAATRSYVERHPRMVEAVEIAGIRTTLGVPMIKDNILIGIVGVFRQEVRPFNDKQVALITNFAAQAVIAIENARLLNQLRQRTDDLSQRTTDLTEALEHQTATSVVLNVISSSPGELDPVFNTILYNAARICQAQFGTLNLYDGSAFRTVALHNPPPQFAMRLGESWRPHPESGLAYVAQCGQVAHIDDIRTRPPYLEGDKAVVELAQLGGARTLLIVPMLDKSKLIGAISIYRQEVRPFTDRQIALVQNFAAQAVIAIENARLLNELRQRTADLSRRTTDLTEALEQQTATSDVLEVISRSAFDLQAVFETVAESSVRLCGADRAFIFRFDGELLRMVVGYNSTPGFVEWVAKNPIRPGRHSGSARAALERRTIHIADVLADAEYVYGAKDVEPIRTVLGVPILKGDDLLGVMMIYRLEVRPFTDRQIALVETFADQAAIAIENVRLLDELRERTQEIEKLNKHLEQRVTDQVDEIERMGRLRRFLPPQVADLIVASGSEKQLESHRREITALFCDLRGFTGFTESADAEDVIALLREYHAAVGEKIIKYSGTLERYAGDGVMVVFNDPVPVENPALQAVLMALEMRDAIGALTETWRRWGHEIGFGIGISHGFATLGTIGFEGRFDYAAIGTVSNVASRLCDEAKPGQILISPRVLTKVENAVKVEPVGEFELKGIRRPLAAYNVLGATSRQIKGQRSGQ